MRARCDRLGGRLRMERRTGGGMRLTVEVPVARPAMAAS
jgi:hypothetical protein